MIYIVIYENGMLSMIFPNSLSHVDLFIPLTENKLLARVSKGVTQILHYVFFKKGKIVSLGVL